MALERFDPAGSSAVATAAYDAARRELHITFTSGRAYVYLAVPPLIFEALKQAPSTGVFVNLVVKRFYKHREAEPVR